MKRIYAQMEQVKEQYRVGLISREEMNKELSRLEFQLMGCDY